MLLRLKLWVAERLGVRRLQEAVEYLLISNLNLSAGRDDGEPSNNRLKTVFFDLVSALGPTVFCDIGANDGSTAGLMKQRLPGCTVLAFEANPAIHAMYRDQPELAQVRYLNMAVADRDTTMTMFAPLTLSRAYVGGEVVPANITEAPNTGKTSLLRRNEDATYQEISVEARRLDTILRQQVGALSGQRVVLWIDVEGAADKVLAGARATLRHTLAVFVETENFDFWQAQSKSSDVARMLIAQGFMPVARDREYADKQFNTLFVHRSVLPLVHPMLFDVGARILIPAAPAAPVAAAPRPAGATTHRFRTLGAGMLARTPVLIPAFNNETYVARMISQLRGRGLENLVVVDNASTAPGFLSFLDRIAGDVSVIRLAENKGPRDITGADANFVALPEVFCITDPDLDLNPDLPEDFLAELLAISQRHKVGKVGFALDIWDRAAMRDDSYMIGPDSLKIWEWEAKFWQREVGTTSTGDPCYRAEIDTTFALYNKKHFSRACPTEAIRIAGRYTCRHLPWYKDAGIPKAEEELYRATQKFSYYLAGGPGTDG